MIRKRKPEIIAILSLLLCSICLYYASLPEKNAIVASLRQTIQDFLLNNPYLLRYSTSINEIKIRVLLITLLLTVQALFVIVWGNIQQKHILRQFDINKLRSSFELLGLILPVSNLIGTIISIHLIGKFAGSKVMDFFLNQYHFRWNFHARDYEFVEFAILLAGIVILSFLYNNFWRVLAFAIGFSMGIVEIGILAEPLYNQLHFTFPIWLLLSFALTVIVGRLARNRKKPPTIEESRPSDPLNRFKHLYQRLPVFNQIILVFAIIFLIFIFGLSFLSNYKAVFLALGLFVGFTVLIVFFRSYPNIAISGLLVVSIGASGIYSLVTKFPTTDHPQYPWGSVRFSWASTQWISVTNVSALSHVYTVNVPKPLELQTKDPEHYLVNYAPYPWSPIGKLVIRGSSTLLPIRQFLLLETQPPLVNEHFFVITVADIASNGFTVQEYVTINPAWLEAQKKELTSIPNQVDIPDPKIVISHLGFITREIKVIPSLIPDKSGFISVSLPDQAVMKGSDAATYSIRLIDVPKNAFLEAREAKKMERFPYVGVETITWSSLEHADAISFAYIPPPYNHIRTILEPFIGISSISQLLLVLCSLIAAFLVSSSAKASILVGLKENFTRIFKKSKPGSQVPETRKLVISGSGEEKDVKVEEKNKAAGKRKD